MGDTRYDPPLARLREATDRASAMRDLDYEGLVLALGAASRERDPYLANVLTTELLNRSRRGAARAFSIALGMSAALVLIVLGVAVVAAVPHNVNDHVLLLVTFVALGFGALGARLAYSRLLERALTRRV